MAVVSSAIKFTQGITTDVAGNALFGIAGSAVVASNGDNTNVKRWTWILTDVPPGSALVTGNDGTNGQPLVPSQDGSSSTFQFTPDVAGGYALTLITWDASGKVTAKSANVFGVKQPSGRFIPPFRAVASMLKFAGQLRGWSPHLEAWLKFADSIMDGSDATWGISPGGQILTYRRSGTTVTGSTATLFTVTCPDNHNVGVDAIVIGRETTGAIGARFDLSHGFARNGGGAPVAMGTPTSSSRGTNGGSAPASYAATIDNSGNNLRVTATGPAQSVNWTAVVQLVIDA